MLTESLQRFIGRGVPDGTTPPGSAGRPAGRPPASLPRPGPWATSPHGSVQLLP